MPSLREASFAFFGFPILIVLGGCGAKVECESPEARSAVLKLVSDDHANALAAYAAKRSNVAGEVERSANSEGAKPLYQLGESIATTSASKDGRTVQCSGSMSAIVGDTRASKEINFTVQKSSDGKISVSVAPFQF
jgi:hypothetical protein